MKWYVYYDNGTVITSDECSVWDLPGRGVQYLVNIDESKTYQVVSGYDYYVWRHKWCGVDLFGLYDYLLEPRASKVLFGRTIPGSQYDNLYKQLCDTFTAKEKAEGYVKGEVR